MRHVKTKVALGVTLGLLCEISHAGSLVWENDIFNQINRRESTDRYYTQGMRFVTERNPTDTNLVSDGILRWLSGNGTAVATNRHYLTFGQTIYTPRSITMPTEEESDRSYAAWMFAGLMAVRVQEIDYRLGLRFAERIDRVEAQLGVVGPMALGEPVQKTFHEIIGSDDPKGWDRQLRNSAGATVLWDRKWQSQAYGRNERLSFDAIPGIGLMAGNIQSYMHAECVVRMAVFSALPSPWSPEVIPQSTPMSDIRSGQVSSLDTRIGFYLFVGGDARLYANNGLIEGMDSDDFGRPMEPLVHDFKMGFGLTIPEGIHFVFAYILRSEEFEGQDGRQEFGSVAVSTDF